MKRYVATCIVAAVALVAIPASAQVTITRGVDLFQTAGGTSADFSINPIPAGFFCPGSAPFAGVIPLTGVPLRTVPPGVASTTDTIVERLANGFFPAGGGTVSIPVIVRALQLRGGPLAVFCPDEGITTLWDVDVCLCGTQPTTSITVQLNNPACGCGVFNGSLRLNICITFTRRDTGEQVGPVTQTISMAITNMSWCTRTAAGGTVIASPFAVDTDCDDCPDRMVPGTTNFHPGYNCPSVQPGADCFALFGHLTTCHKGPSPDHPHCINPVCGPRTN